MSKFGVILIVLLSGLFSISFAEDDACPFPEIYIEFDRSYHQCANGQVRKGESCDKFLDYIARLFSEYNCLRSYDADPVPAIWLFDAALEDYIRLLYEIASGENEIYNGRGFVEEKSRARKIFPGPEFKSVLDGHLAEEYYPLIDSLRENAP